MRRYRAGRAARARHRRADRRDGQRAEPARHDADDRCGHPRRRGAAPYRTGGDGHPGLGRDRDLQPRSLRRRPRAGGDRHRLYRPCGRLRCQRRGRGPDADAMHRRGDGWPLSDRRQCPRTDRGPARGGGRPRHRRGDDDRGDGSPGWRAGGNAGDLGLCPRWRAAGYQRQSRHPGPAAGQLAGDRLSHSAGARAGSATGGRCRTGADPGDGVRGAATSGGAQDPRAGSGGCGVPGWLAG